MKTAVADRPKTPVIQATPESDATTEVFFERLLDAIRANRDGFREKLRQALGVR